MKKIAACISGILILAASGLPVFGATEKTPDTKDLFEKKCSTCHSFNKATSKKKTLKEWESTVMRMIESRNAKITEDEAKLIINYLGENYKK